MSFIGNLLWIIFGGGIFIFFEYIMGGLALCVTIIGIPFGIQCFKLAYLSLVPFGKEVVHTDTASGCLTTIMNLIWILFGGIWVSLTHLLFGLLCAITIIGIPFAKQHAKLAAFSLFPFGREVREIK
ncbi:MAG: YccF domain-containing protein [Acidobacteriota bacterium]